MRNNATKKVYQTQPACKHSQALSTVRLVTEAFAPRLLRQIENKSLLRSTNSVTVHGSARKRTKTQDVAETTKKEELNKARRT
jgi:hypothetical protein